MKSVLIVDDSTAITMILQKALLMRGEFNITTVKNGMEALDYLKTEIPELILLDIAMPVMNGLEFLEKIRGIDTYKEIPVIILSSNKNAETIKQVATLGVSDYLLKPINMQLMYDKVSKIISNR